MSNSLYEHVVQVATTLRRNATGLRRLLGHDAGDAQTAADFRAISESVVYLTFIDLNGNPDAPDKFNWGGTRFLNRIRTRFSQELQGKGTNYYDYRMRVIQDRTPSSARVRWTSWDTGAYVKVAEVVALVPEGHSQDANRQRMHIVEALQITPQEQELERQEIQDKINELRSVLSDDEFWLLTQHYIEERKLPDIAKEVAATRYKGDPRGVKKAESWAYTTIHRARKRARERITA